jgi:hypothetical protein
MMFIVRMFIVIMFMVTVTVTREKNLKNMIEIKQYNRF